MVFYRVIHYDLLKGRIHMYRLFYNGNIISMDNIGTVYNWIYIEHGVIIDAGNYEGYHKYLNKTIDTVDLDGNSVLPGFTDSHVYLVQTGINKLAVDLSEATSIDEVIQLLVKRASETSKGKLVRGVKLDECNLNEKRLPNKFELDKYFKEHPVWINRIEKHTSIVNSYALRELKLPFNLQGIEYDGNIPTGIVYDRANAFITNKFYSQIADDVRDEGVQLAFEHAMEKGITTINAMEAGFAFCDRDGEFVYLNKEKFPIDVNLFYQTLDLEKLNRMGIKRVGCLFLDGSIGSRTAALSSPYADDPTCNGSLYFSKKSLDDIVLKAHLADFQLAIHAVGDKAIEMILNSIEKALASYPKVNHRHRIEHFELPSKSALEKSRKLGVIASMVPNAIEKWSKEGATYGVRLGRDRLNINNPFRDVLNYGIKIAAGSDSDTTEMDPFKSMQAIVDNKNVHQGVSINEALKMFTIDAAYANFEDRMKGSIERGKLADLIIINQNPYDIDPSKLSQIQVLETVKNGLTVYKSGAQNE